jgi:phosphoribosylformylglycinamidine cyclo-ligase
MAEPNPYRDAGVDYDVLDAVKREALAAAAATSPALIGHGARAIDDSRGAPAFLFEAGGQTLALVQECLGTKSIVARRYQELSGENRFDAVAYDAVAAIANDLASVGALPLVINAYFSVGSADWFRDQPRMSALIAGWRQGCEDAGATWGGGESPALPGLVSVQDVELAGSGVGRVPAGRRPLLGETLDAGDEIVLVASSGIHTNGLSLAMQVARAHPEGFLTPLPSGETLGAALLRPSLIYVRLVRALLESDVDLRYLSHITGHGLRKLMRAPGELTYRLSTLPPVPEVLQFTVDALGLAPRDAYGTFNMGAGFALYGAAGTGGRIVEIARALGFDAQICGRVESGPRQVVLEPLGVIFQSEALQLR